MRTSRHSVTFRFPFSLRGLDGPQPPGTYAIETDEERIEELSFAAFRRVSTSIVLPLGSASYQMRKVDPADLAAAQALDAERAASEG